ncbi:hypothetical protein [Curvivirga sp.]|uniref:hypothetical protein n=1 Tax=Curvivirga sp. TaxID=2856848 RepID=UPI003B5CBD50
MITTLNKLHAVNDNYAASRCCSKCSSNKPITEFYRSKRDGYDSSCKMCRKAQQKARNQTLDGKIKRAVYNSAKRAKHKGLEHSITYYDVKQMWNEQDSICALSGEPMLFDGIPYADNGVSIDRKDSRYGYTKGNVHLTTNKVNKMKGNKSIEEFMEKVANDNTPQQLNLF